MTIYRKLHIYFLIFQKIIKIPFLRSVAQTKYKQYIEHQKNKQPTNKLANHSAMSMDTFETQLSGLFYLKSLK
jgi:hypothetical protein